MANKLDPQKIVSEAIALMGEGEGLESLSLRKLAARLGVKAPSLYRHVSSKSDLFALMSASIFRQCLARIPPCDSWENWLLEFGMSLWMEQHRMPGTLQLIAFNRSRHSGKPPVAEDVVRMLEALGLPTARAMVAQSSVQALATGWTMMFPLSIEEDGAAFRASLEALIRGWR